MKQTNQKVVIQTLSMPKLNDAHLAIENLNPWKIEKFFCLTKLFLSLFFYSSHFLLRPLSAAEAIDLLNLSFRFSDYDRRS